MTHDNKSADELRAEAEALTNALGNASKEVAHAARKLGKTEAEWAAFNAQDPTRGKDDRFPNVK